MPDLEIIADYGDLCGDCRVWHAAEGALYWTDCSGSRFYRYDPEANRHAVVHQGFQVNGFRPNRAGGFVVTNNQGVWLWDGGARQTLICSKIDGAVCQLNDCIAD